MKKSIYNIAIALFLIPLVSFGNDKTPTKQRKSKTIKKEYSVDSNATVDIDNKYGAINITTWNENRVEITVVITVKGSNESTLERRLRDINVAFNATSDRVSAKTIIEKNRRSWSFWGGNRKNSSLQINYFIKMPVTNNVVLDNDYGSIVLNELNGSADINCDYGKITIGELNNTNNTINLDYCSPSTISFMEAGTIDVDYSKLTVDKTTTAKVNSDYSTLHFGSAKTITFNSDYGNITIDNADNITGNTDYVSVRLGTISKNLNLKADYGSLRIKEIIKGFENIDITGKYVSIKIGTSTHNSFDFTIDLSYAGFRYNENHVDLRKDIQKSSKKHFEGFYGKGTSSSKLTIKSQYGSVSLTEL